MHRKLLITGFAPFGGESINPSWEAVKALPETIGEVELIKRELPVEFGRAAEILLTAVREFSPDAVIAVGQAGGRPAITPEVLAANLKNARIPDNAGASPEWEIIDPEGPDGIFTGLPVRAMVGAMEEAGIPAALSYSAGTYVCNDVFYSLVRETKSLGIPAGFIHVPYIPEQTRDMAEMKPSLALPEITRGLQICIETLLYELRSEMEGIK